MANPTKTAAVIEDWGTRNFPMVRPVSSLMSVTEICAVGGVDAQHFAAYRAAGVCGFGLGTALFTPEITAEELRTRAQEAMVVWLDISRVEKD